MSRDRPPAWFIYAGAVVVLLVAFTAIQLAGDESKPQPEQVKKVESGDEKMSLEKHVYESEGIVCYKYTYWEQIECLPLNQTNTQTVGATP